MFKIRVTISVLIMIGGCTSIHAKTIFRCPKDVEVRQALTVQKKIDSWEGVESIATHKHKRTFFQRINDLGELREDDEIKSGDRTIFRWEIGELNDVYLKCAYVGTSFTFERKVPDQIKYCEITVEEKHALTNEREVACY